MRTETIADTSTLGVPENGVSSGTSGADQVQSHEDIVAFGQLLWDSDMPSTAIIPIILDSVASPYDPLSRIDLAHALHDVFPAWENNALQYTSVWLNKSKKAGHKIKTTKTNSRAWYYLENPTDTKLPTSAGGHEGIPEEQITAKGKRQHLPAKEVLPPEVEDAREVQQIPSVIEKRAALRNEKNVPRLIRYKDPDTQLLYAQIETPSGKHTKPLNLTSDELNLFRTIFENSDVYSRTKLELAMVDISRSRTYESNGGFELAFNSLNQKLLRGWNICVAFNEDGRAVLTSPNSQQSIATTSPRSVEDDESERNEGRIRKGKRPSHGKLK